METIKPQTYIVVGEPISRSEELLLKEFLMPWELTDEEKAFLADFKANPKPQFQ